MNKFVHFNDNAKQVTNRDDPNYDWYYKVRPLLISLRDACLNVEPEEKMSVDEQMIPYKGKNYCANISKKNKEMGIQSARTLWFKWIHIRFPHV